MVRSRQAFSLERVRPSSGNGRRRYGFGRAFHRRPALDDRSRFAIHHSVNVAVYAVHMARDLGFDPERQAKIGLAACCTTSAWPGPENIIHKRGP